jgi:acetyl esterase/lipase
VSAYFRLTDDLHIAPERILIAGDSALALLMYLRDNNYPLPAGAVLMSPWVDLTLSCDSWESNANVDIVPTPSPGDPLNPINCYLGEHMEKYLTVRAYLVFICHLLVVADDICSAAPLRLSTLR